MIRTKNSSTMVKRRRFQSTELSISADGDFGEMKKTKTPSKRRRVRRQVQQWSQYWAREVCVRLRVYV